MDLLKIGNFIASCRKAQNLTQSQLAEKLDITDRAVSKWETGRALPDASIMLKLCAILKITVNDLLSGEIISMENKKENEDLLIQLVKEKEKRDIMLLSLEWVIAILSILVLMIPIIIGSFMEIEEWKKVLICLSGFIPCIVGVLFAFKIEQVAGYYECQKCKHRYVPTFKDSIVAMHFGRTKYLKCPCCQKRSWSKKVISKEHKD